MQSQLGLKKFGGTIHLCNLRENIVWIGTIILTGEKMAHPKGCKHKTRPNPMSRWNVVPIKGEDEGP